MRIELSRTYPVPRETGFAYVMDPEYWTDWLKIDAVDPKAFAKKGDVVDVRFHTLFMSLLGKIELLEVDPGHMAKLGIHHVGLVPMELTFEFANAGAHAFTLTLVMTADPESLVERSMWFVMLAEPAMRLSLPPALDRLHTHFIAHERMAA